MLTGTFSLKMLNISKQISDLSILIKLKWLIFFQVYSSIIESFSEWEFYPNLPLAFIVTSSLCCLTDLCFAKTVFFVPSILPVLCLFVCVWYLRIFFFHSFMPSSNSTIKHSWTSWVAISQSKSFVRKKLTQQSFIKKFKLSKIWNL